MTTESTRLMEIIWQTARRPQAATDRLHTGEHDAGKCTALRLSTCKTSLNQWLRLTKGGLVPAFPIGSPA